MTRTPLLALVALLSVACTSDPVDSPESETVSGGKADSVTSVQPVVIDFDADWNETQSGPIAAGSKVILHYDPARLSICSGSMYGRAAWNITANYRVDDGEIQGVLVGVADGTQLVAADPEIEVGSGQELILWFETSSMWGCHEYDSDYGNNYHFVIE